MSRRELALLCMRYLRSLDKYKYDFEKLIVFKL